MPRALGFELIATGPPLGCGSNEPHDYVPHHDHMYDLVHRRILEALSPSDPIGSGRRPDFGRAFSDFLRQHGQQILTRLENAQIRPGVGLMRFTTTMVCARINPLDGNGKPHAAQPRTEEVRYWSMTPEELLAVSRSERDWNSIFVADRDARKERLELVDRLVAEIVLESGAARGSRR